MDFDAHKFCAISIMFISKEYIFFRWFMSVLSVYGFESSVLLVLFVQLHYDLLKICSDRRES